MREDEDILLILDDDDEEAGLDDDFADEYDIVEDEEAGILEMIIPAAVAADMRRRGKMPRVRGRGRRRRRRTRGAASRLSKWVKRNRRDIKSIKRMLRGRIDSGTSFPSNADEPGGFRPLIGSTLAIGAPGAAGLAAFGPLNIQTTNQSRVATLVVELVEDTYAAAAAGNTVINPAPFIITALTLAGSNMLRSTAPAVPGTLFSVAGQHYGYPLGTQRHVTMPPSTTLTINGQFNPRAPGGASAADATAALLAPRLVA